MFVEVHQRPAGAVFFHYTGDNQADLEPFLNEKGFQIDSQDGTTLNISSSAGTYTLEAGNYVKPENDMWGPQFVVRTPTEMNEQFYPASVLPLVN